MFRGFSGSTVAGYVSRIIEVIAQIRSGLRSTRPILPETAKNGPKNPKILNFQISAFYDVVYLGKTTGGPETVLALQVNGVWRPFEALTSAVL